MYLYLLDPAAPGAIINNRMAKVSKRVWLIITGAVLVFCTFLVMSGQIVLAADWYQVGSQSECSEPWMQFETRGDTYWCRDTCDDVSTLGDACRDGQGGIWGILNMILDVLTIGVGAAAIIGLVIAGIIYGTAGGNDSKVALAKQMIFNIVIGLLLYGILWAILNFVLPGNVASGG